jgi:hypothetical protein
MAFINLPKDYAECLCSARLSGLPVEALRKAVKTGKLKVIKSAGRGFGKVKRTELEAYVRKL